MNQADKSRICWIKETYNYLIDGSSENKKAKGTKQCVLKRKLKIEDYKNCIEPMQIV